MKFRRPLTILLPLFAVGSLTLACNKQPDPPQRQEAPKALHATGAVPGSYEDWCEEHQVPESQCTQCNASLIAAFKATGDWCEEHQLPESQCRKCNPDLKIERPQKKAQ